MKYVENPEVNGRVAGIIHQLSLEIVSRFHPKSLILTGSFGRGEATVVKKNGDLKFLSDCEVMIIPYKHIFCRRDLFKFKSEFYSRTGLKVEIGGATLTLYLLAPFLVKRIKPTIANYDLKYGSKVLYGMSYLKNIPTFRPEDIPLWEGIRLLFNRMAEALMYFSIDNPTGEMFFWTDKIVLACQDVLLLSLGKYHPSCKERNFMFQHLFPKHFNQVRDDLGSLPDFAKEATRRKLRGTVNVNHPVEYWFNVAKICDKIIRYVLKKDMGIEFHDYLEMQEKYLKHPKLTEYSQNSFMWETYTPFQNIIKTLRILILYKRFNPLELITYGIPHEHVVYSTIPLVYFSLLGNSNEREYYLHRCQKILSVFGNMESAKDFQHLKDRVLRLWHYLCC